MSKNTDRNGALAGAKVAFLVADGFEQEELSEPRTALGEAGAETVIVAPPSRIEGRVVAWRGKEWGWEFPVDVPLEEARPEDYDALVVPGGVMSPDHLRTQPQAVDFVRHFVERKKPVASICHGPWVLIDAGGVQGRKLTSYRSLKTDLTNAGADWCDAGVVVSDGLVTSRGPKDLPEFVEKTLEVFARARDEARRATATAS